MTSPAETFRNRLGSCLVGLQFGSLIWLALLNLPNFRDQAIAWTTVVLAMAGIGLGLWSVSTNQPGNFNIRPQPRQGGQLIMSGPYRWIRHPMYTSVLMWGVACAWGSASIWGWLALTVLTLALVAKAHLEESWMTQLHPLYANYRQHTWWFVPWLF
jgi:protein-S-isoprenylcysteine O-methyltransferase Ste14